MSESFSVLRIGIAISVAIHLVALIAGLGYAGYLLVPESSLQAIAVDLVTPKEVTEMIRPLTPDAPTLPPKGADQFPDPLPPQQPKLSKAALREARRAEAAARKQAALQAPQTEAAIVPPDPDLSLQIPMLPSVFGGTPLSYDPNNFDAKATTPARVDNADIAAFRAHLKKCSLLPSDVSFDDKVSIVIRAQFFKDGRLSTAPLLIEASASTKGPLLTQAAIAALHACQPFGTLPPAKYDEWKLLDLSFTPQDFRRG